LCARRSRCSRPAWRVPCCASAKRDRKCERASSSAGREGLDARVRSLLRVAVREILLLGGSTATRASAGAAIACAPRRARVRFSRHLLPACPRPCAPYRHIDTRPFLAPSARSSNLRSCRPTRG
jgi:hypothetical protein